MLRIVLRAYFRIFDVYSQDILYITLSILHMHYRANIVMLRQKNGSFSQKNVSWRPDIKILTKQAVIDKSKIPPATLNLRKDVGHAPRHPGILELVDG